MKQLLSIGILLFYTTMYCTAQDIDAPPPPSPPTAEEGAYSLSLDSAICAAPDQFPLFEGGDEALNQFIRQSMRYPTYSKEMGYQGKVYVSLIVEKDGQVSHLEIVRGIKGATDLEQEALRLARLIQFKEPAKRAGQPVRYKMVLPMYFLLK